jgi:hypothetical protein
MGCVSLGIGCRCGGPQWHRWWDWEAIRLTSKGGKPYLHESRHSHAMRRPRGPGERLLTADEVAEIERTKGDGGVGGRIGGSPERGSVH